MTYYSGGRAFHLYPTRLNITKLQIPTKPHVQKFGGIFFHENLVDSLPLKIVFAGFFYIYFAKVLELANTCKVLTK